MGLSTTRRSLSVAGPSQPRIRRPPREPRQPAQKPYAAVRRAPRPPRAISGPEQYSTSDRDRDIRASLSPSQGQAAQLFRKGELLWCFLDPPIRGHVPEEDISFWPGIVEEVRCRSIAQPIALPPAQESMASLFTEAEENNPALGVPASLSGPGSMATAPVEAQGDVPWRTQHVYAYKMKLLGTTQVYHMTDQQVLPYLGYMPSAATIRRVQDELGHYLEAVSIDEMDRTLEGLMFDFNPNEPEPTAPDSTHAKFRRAAAPYTLALQIAANLATFWLPTDEWTCKFILPVPPPATNGSGARSATPDSQVQTIHSIIQSMNNNAASPSKSNESAAPPMEPESISTAGNFSRPSALSQTVQQTHYQGIWWGTERIWTDELVRLKIARRQFAPQGTDVIRPPAGPSAATLDHIRSRPDTQDMDIQQFGAGERGLFFRVEELFIVNTYAPDGSESQECRASGMVYELVDQDWEELEVAKPPESNTEGKGKGREEPNGGM